MIMRKKAPTLAELRQDCKDTYIDVSNLHERLMERYPDFDKTRIVFSDKWRTMEDAIDNAVARGQGPVVQDLLKQYWERAHRFYQTWEAKIIEEKNGSVKKENT